MEKVPVGGTVTLEKASPDINAEEEIETDTDALPEADPLPVPNVVCE